jgi:hypothetical protein
MEPRSGRPSPATGATAIALALFVFLPSCATTPRRPTTTSGPKNLLTTVITDSMTGLVWTREISAEMAWSEARSFCTKLRVGGLEDWRLPTEEEIDTLVEPPILKKEADPRHPDRVITWEERRLREPFRSVTPAMGCLFTGQHVYEDEEAPFVMMIETGHVFNGKGHMGFVRCVRLRLFVPKRPPEVSGEMVTSLLADRLRRVAESGLRGGAASSVCAPDMSPSGVPWKGPGACPELESPRQDASVPGRNACEARARVAVEPATSLAGHVSARPLQPDPKLERLSGWPDVDGHD